MLQLTQPTHQVTTFIPTAVLLSVVRLKDTHFIGFLFSWPLEIKVFWRYSWVASHENTMKFARNFSHNFQRFFTELVQ